MTLTEFYAERSFGGLDLNEWESSLKENHPFNIEVITPGIIRVNNKVIQCVNHYFTLKDNQGKKIKTFSPSPAQECHHTQKMLGLTPRQSDCRSCHLECLEKLRSGDLARVPSKRKKK